MLRFRARFPSWQVSFSANNKRTKFARKKKCGRIKREMFLLSFSFVGLFLRLLRERERRRTLKKEEKNSLLQSSRLCLCLRLCLPFF